MRSLACIRFGAVMLCSECWNNTSRHFTRPQYPQGTGLSVYLLPGRRERASIHRFGALQAAWRESGSCSILHVLHRISGSLVSFVPLCPSNLVMQEKKGLVLMRGEVNLSVLQPTDAVSLPASQLSPLCYLLNLGPQAFLGNQTTIWYFDEVTSIPACTLTPLSNIRNATQTLSRSSTRSPANLTSRGSWSAWADSESRSQSTCDLCRPCRFAAARPGCDAGCCYHNQFFLLDT